MGTAIKPDKRSMTGESMTTESSSARSASRDNPLLGAWDTPFAVPPFAAIRPEHVGPAVAAAFAAHRGEIAAIADEVTHICESMTHVKRAASA